MDAARSSLGHHVDSTDIEDVAGTARILLRFTVPASNAVGEDMAAQAAAQRARDGVDVVAGTGRERLLRRHHGSWLGVRVRPDSQG